MRGAELLLLLPRWRLHNAAHGHLGPVDDRELTGSDLLGTASGIVVGRTCHRPAIVPVDGKPEPRPIGWEFYNQLRLERIGHGDLLATDLLSARAIVVQLERFSGHHTTASVVDRGLVEPSAAIHCGASTVAASQAVWSVEISHSAPRC